MRGLFSKLMNKFNDPSNQAKSNNSSQSQNQVQTQTINSNILIHIYKIILYIIMYFK